jgi:hypothetical protein
MSYSTVTIAQNKKYVFTFDGAIITIDILMYMIFFAFIFCNKSYVYAKNQFSYY